MRFFSLVTAGALAFVACFARIALAEDHDASVLRAAVARDRALDTGHPRDWEEAADLFAASLEERPTPKTAFELGSALERLDRDDEAFEAYQDALALGLTGVAAERARAFLAAHERSFAELEVRGPPGSRVYVNEQRRGVLPLARPVVVSPGSARVNVAPPKLRAWQAEVHLEAGERKSVVAVFHPDRSSSGGKTAPAGEQRSRGRQESASAWGVPAALAGAGALLLGGAGIAVTSVRLVDQRRALGASCSRLDGDRCLYTTSDRAPAAQSAADQVVAMKSLRWASIGGAAAGAVSLGVGLFDVFGRGGSKGTAPNLAVRASARQLEVEWRRSF